MTYEEILENNKLIAKFIDLTPHNLFPDELQAPDNFGWMAVNVNVNSDYAKEDNEFIGFEEFFQFHKSWDWLMPVVDKIELLNHNVLIYNGYVLINTYHDWFECNPEVIENRYTDKNMFEINNYGENKLETTYLSVIEFIKWYNINKL